MHQQLRAILDRASAIAVEKFNEHGALGPFVVADTPDGPRNWQLPAEADDSKKNIVAAYFKFLLKNAGATAYVWVCEAWALEVKGLPPEEIERQMDLVREFGIRNHPLRYEAVYLMAKRPDLPAVIATHDIIRPTGQEPYLGDLRIEDRGNTEGRFADLFTLTAGEERVYADLQSTFSKLMGKVL